MNFEDRARGIRRAHIAAAFLLLCLCRYAHSADGVALLVPAYFGPSSGYWQHLNTAAAQVPILAIANVSNGPGNRDTPHEGYAAVIRGLRTAGGRVIGYVYTQYGRRSLDVVKQDMRRWHGLYALDGFFIDEMANQAQQPLLQYYTELYRYAQELKSGYTVVGNPGTTTEEAFLKSPTADCVVTFENRTGYANFAPSAWMRGYPPSGFGLLAYEIAGADTMTNVVNLAVSRRAGFVYVTDDAGRNPWDTLPTYWQAEVAHVASINREAAKEKGARLLLDSAVDGTSFTLTAGGTAGRHVLETAPSLLGRWQPVATNLTSTGTSIWRLLNFFPERFFRTRHD